MKPKPEEFLNRRPWSATRARLTFCTLTDACESWAYRNDLRRQVATLQQRPQRPSVARSDISVEPRITQTGVNAIYNWPIYELDVRRQNWKN